MILSLGCSHSCGSYTAKDFSLRRDAPRHHDVVLPPYHNQHREFMDDWPSEVGRVAESAHYHIAIPGHGILSYYEILKALEDNDLLHSIDKLLIQHTQELRTVTSTTPTRFNDFLHETVIPEFKMNTDDFIFRSVTPDGEVLNINAPMSLFGNLRRFTTGKIPSEQKLFFLDTMETLSSLMSYTQNIKNIFDLTLAEIHRICERNNIKYYDFAWDFNASFSIERTKDLRKTHVISDSEFMIVKKEFSKLGIDGNNFYSLLSRGGHLMKEGTDIANKIILDYLHTTDIFDK